MARTKTPKNRGEEPFRGISEETPVTKSITEVEAYERSCGFLLRELRERRRLRVDQLAGQADSFLTSISKLNFTEASLKDVIEGKLVVALPVCESLAQVLIDENPAVDNKIEARRKLGEAYIRSSKAIGWFSSNKDETHLFARTVQALFAQTKLPQNKVVEHVQEKLRKPLAQTEQRDWDSDKTSLIAEIEGGKCVPSVFLMYAISSALNSVNALGEMQGRQLFNAYSNQTTSLPIQPVRFEAKREKS